MKKKFKILDTGNLFFPFIDKGKKFIVEDTLEVTLDKKNTRFIDFCLENKEPFYFGMLARPVWDTFKQLGLEEYKDCWFVPLCLYKMGKEYICSIDVLRKVIPKKKNGKKHKKSLGRN